MAVPVTLQVFKGNQLIATREYNRDMIKIGRLASAHLCLDDEKVSRIHSVIECHDNGTLSITDMGGVEGTFVNGKRVNKGPITFGDEIRLGATLIRVCATQVAADNLAQAVAPSPPQEEVGQQTLTDVTGALSQAAGTPAVVVEPPAAEPPPPPPAEPAYDSATTERVAVPQAATAPARAPRVRSRRKKGSGPLGLELRFMWGDQMVGEYFLKPGVNPPFTVGSGEGVSFAMGDSKLGVPVFKAVTSDAQGFQLRFTGKMKGELTRRGETMELRQAIESGKANNDGEAYSLVLEPDDFAWVDLGGVTLEVCFQPVPKPVIVPLGESMDFTALNIFVAVFFLAALFIISAKNQQLAGDEYADELASNEARIAKLIVKPPEVQKNPFLEKLAQQKAEKTGEMAAKAKGQESQAGSQKETRQNNNRASAKGDPSKKDQAHAMAQRIFGGKGGISNLFGSSGLGGDLKSAMGGLIGSAVGDSKGFGGMGLKGSVGGGGGGVGTGPAGIGAIGTKGRGGGTGSYGEGVGVLGGKKAVDIGISSSEAEVMGSLDKELIRQVIRSHIDQIRFCYESQLNRFPKLGGTVAVKFVISGSGSVVDSRVAHSSMGNADVETCLAGRVRTWTFPKPKGGGIVNVTYPFTFKRSGD